MQSHMTRRQLLRTIGIGSAGLALAACQPKVVEVTRVVEKEVEKVVKETVVVEKEVMSGAAPLPPQTLRFGFGG